MGRVIQFTNYAGKEGPTGCLEDRYISGFREILKHCDGKNTDRCLLNAPEISALSLKMIELLEDAKENPELAELTQTVAAKAMMAIDNYTLGVRAIIPTRSDNQRR